MNDYTFLGQQIDYIVNSIKCNLDFQNQLYKIIGSEEIPLLDEAINFEIIALWNFICKAIGYENENDFWVFNDCIYDLGFNNELHWTDENDCFLVINDGKTLMETFFKNK